MDAALTVHVDGFIETTNKNFSRLQLKIEINISSQVVSLLSNSCANLSILYSC